MAYVPAKARFGMGAYRRRGLGLSCPGDPGCPGSLTPTQQATQAATSNICTCQVDGTCLENGNDCVYTGPAASVPIGGTVVTGSQTLTQWLNANMTTVMLGGVALVAVSFMGGGRRRY